MINSPTLATPTSTTGIRLPEISDMAYEGRKRSASPVHFDTSHERNPAMLARRSLTLARAVPARALHTSSLWYAEKSALETRLRDSLKTAMKARDKAAVSTLKVSAPRAQRAGAGVGRGLGGWVGFGKGGGGWYWEELGGLGVGREQVEERREWRRTCRSLWECATPLDGASRSLRSAGL